MLKQIPGIFALVTVLLLSGRSYAADLKVGDTAPDFTLPTQDGTDFSLASREGKWTVLYFYPKAGTPGCTKEACSFRDNVEKIHAQGAEVYGISSDTVKDQAEFYKEHHLNFPLLANPDSSVLVAYGTKLPLVKFSRRWTFIIGPDLKIKDITKDVDPVTDSVRVAKQIETLKGK